MLAHPRKIHYQPSVGNTGGSHPEVDSLSAKQRDRFPSTICQFGLELSDFDVKVM
jgi:hypothetical protein